MSVVPTNARRLRRLAAQCDPCAVGGPDARLLIASANEIERFRVLAKAIVDNDPDDMVADGVTVLDAWRKEAEWLLAYEDG